MLNKSHRSVVSTCVLIFIPYFKKKKKKFFSKKKHLFFSQKKNTIRKKTCFFCITEYGTTKIFDSILSHNTQYKGYVRHIKGRVLPPFRHQMAVTLWNQKRSAEAMSVSAIPTCSEVELNWKIISIVNL